MNIYFIRGVCYLKLRDYQIECVDVIHKVLDGERKLVQSATGCHGRGTKILLYDGSLKNVENVVVGDVIMGKDSSPRRVLELHRGKDEMYRVIPVKGETFIVNKGHILSLRRTNRSENCKSNGKIENISIEEYFEKSNTYKHMHKLYRVGIDFNNKKELIIDPYFLGIWLGDGSYSYNSLYITSADVEIEREIYHFSEKYGLKIRKEYQKDNKSYNYHFIGKIKWNSKNYIKESLKYLGLKDKKSAEKFLPKEYKIANRENRLMLLAGLLDTDGYLGCNCFEYSTKSPQLADDITFLARSLGLAAYKSDKYVKGARYYRVNISGNLEMIPNKILRKKSSPRKQKKSVLVTGFKLESIGVDNYYGFTVDKDNLYVMGDFTVTHNSGKTLILSKIASDANGRVLIVVPSTELREQTEEKLRMVDPFIDIGHVQGSINEISNKVVISTRQSLTHAKSKRIKDMLLHGDFEYLIFDEAHLAPKQIHKILKQINSDVKTIGFTATPYTRDCIEIFGQPIFKRTILDMIDNDFLVEPYAILIQSKTNISNVKITSGDFAQGELERVVNNAERNKLIIESYKKYAADRELTLVFAAGCDHGKELLKDFLEEGIRAAYIDGETPKQDRKKTIESFRTKEIKVLINVMTLTTGFDVPDTDTIFICRPTKSKILFEQIVGRGLRLAENKTDCMIIDIQDVTKRHDLMNIGELFLTNMKHGERLKDAKERVKKEKIDEEVKKEHENKLRIEKELLKQKEIEIVAERIKLINRNMKKGFEGRKLDWFRVGGTAYALSYGFTNYYVIENVNDKFTVFDTNTSKDNKFLVETIEFQNVTDAIDWVERKAGKNSYTDPKSNWKFQRASEAQLKFCSWGKNKWDVSVYFASGTITGMLSKKFMYQKQA